MTEPVPQELVEAFAKAMEQCPLYTLSIEPLSADGGGVRRIEGQRAREMAARLLLKVRDITTGVGNEASNAHASTGRRKPRSMARTHAGKLGD